jgi:hypothetical protein
VVALEFDCHVEFRDLLETDRTLLLFHADGLIENFTILFFRKTSFEFGSIVTISNKSYMKC